MAITEEQRRRLTEKMKTGPKRKVDREAVVAAYLGGEPVADIAKRLGVWTDTVYSHLRAARDEK